MWVEPQGELVWYWDAAAGHLVPLQASLVSGGYGSAVGTDENVFRPWLATLSDTAEDSGEGLWSLCKDAKGTWINPPTAAPPSAEEIREEYQWIDARDLLIRPDSFTGDKIAIAGSVFNIQGDGNLTILQIWVDGGNYDAVLIAYEGDSIGIYEGTWVTVYGVGAGTFTITNAYGAEIDQPLVRADIIDY